MSTVVMSACWPLQMPPTQKAVLISLADNANDHGECWPSIPTICARTCFSERAVHRAINWLEQQGAVTADRSNGRHTRYLVTPEAYQTPADAAEPPQLRHHRKCGTPADVAVKPPQMRQEPPQMRQQPLPEVRSNRKEPSRTVKSNQKKTPASAVSRPDEVTEQTWADWLALRKAKRAPVTETVVKQARAEAGKAGMSLERFLEVWCARGSQGLQADWLKPHERAGPAPNGRPGAAASFHGKTYTGTLLDDIPEDLRPRES